MFLYNGLSKLNNYSIYPNWQLTLDYAPLTIIIPIIKKYVNTTKQLIIKDSKEEVSFVKEVTTSVRNLNMSNLLDITSLERVINKFASTINNTWEMNSKIINVSKHFKSWWNEDCRRDLEKYRLSKSLEDWKTFYRIVKITKYSFFNLKIQEITNKKHGPWELINWVNKQKLLAIKMVEYNS